MCIYIYTHTYIRIYVLYPSFDHVTSPIIAANIPSCKKNTDIHEYKVCFCLYKY